ncbi:hypothetical protein BJV82DRAFT_670965 [Fennellomyces sp. T-0311]|nr:hypothetical protein BJV82DRAFT_670965 [Fennellomyces sp. T-0311]
MAGGRKRQHTAVNPITNYFSREKRQDTKRSPNHENEVPFEQLKTQQQRKRGLGEKTNKKTRQPLQEIGGASNAKLNTGLKSTPEHQEQWTVYSDEAPRSDADDKKSTQAPTQALSSASQESPNEHDKNKESLQEKVKELPNEDLSQELSSQGSRVLSSQLTDDDATDDDPYAGFFDDDDEDEKAHIIKLRRPKRLEKPKVPAQQQQDEETDERAKEKEELVPQFSIPAPSPAFDEPLATFPSDDSEQQSASFPALFTTSLPSDDLQDPPSIGKQDSKLRDDNGTSDKGDNSPSGRTAESLEPTLPFPTDEQYEAHDVLPVPRGKTLLEKLGVQSQKSE